MNGSADGCSNHSGPGSCLSSYQNLIHWLTLPLSGIIVAGNLLIMVGIVGNKRLHNTTNWFFLSLALADLGTGVVLPSVPRMVFDNTLTSRFCFVFHLLPNFIVLSLLANLVLVHCDRYLCIAHPFRYHRWLRRRPLPAILAVWLLPLLFASLPLLGWNRAAPLPTGHCRFSQVFPPEYIYLEVYGLLIPSILATGTMNVCLLRLARRQVRAIQRQYRAVQGGDATSLLEQQLNLRYAKSVTVFLLIFLGCWLPYIIHLHARFLGPAEDPRTYIIVSCLGISSAALVPFALALSNKEYLQVWTRVCPRVRQRCSDFKPNALSSAPEASGQPPTVLTGCNTAPAATLQ